jgi:hypothetical protein
MYLKKFLADGKDRDWRMPAMIRFMRADTISSRRHVHRVAEIVPVLEDVALFRQLEAEGKLHINNNPDPTVKNAPFYEGVAAFDGGETVDDCPYADGTVEQKRWMIGFEKGAKGG